MDIELSSVVLGGPKVVLLRIDVLPAPEVTALGTRRLLDPLLALGLYVLITRPGTLGVGALDVFATVGVIILSNRGIKGTIVVGGRQKQSLAVANARSR